MNFIGGNALAMGGAVAIVTVLSAIGSAAPAFIAIALIGGGTSVLFGSSDVSESLQQCTMQS